MMTNRPRRRATPRSASLSDGSVQILGSEPGAVTGDFLGDPPRLPFSTPTQPNVASNSAEPSKRALSLCPRPTTKASTRASSVTVARDCSRVPCPCDEKCDLGVSSAESVSAAACPWR